MLNMTRLLKVCSIYITVYLSQHTQQLLFVKSLQLLIILFISGVEQLSVLCYSLFLFVLYAFLVHILKQNVNWSELGDSKEPILLDICEVITLTVYLGLHSTRIHWPDQLLQVIFGARQLRTIDKEVLSMIGIHEYLQLWQRTLWPLQQTNLLNICVDFLNENAVDLAVALHIDYPAMFGSALRHNWTVLCYFFINADLLSVEYFLNAGKTDNLYQNKAIVIDFDEQPTPICE